jgi:CxxC motif-containing protein (DUF1111 family)
VKRKLIAPLLLALSAVGLFTFDVEIASSVGPVAQDPGPRGGAAGAGDQIPGLSTTQAAAFADGLDTFKEVDAVADGLGPRMNLDSCAGCHAYPAVGGSSPAVNPQVKFGQAGADTVPPFITMNGPVREARFVRNPDGTADGGVHDLFTITGRSGADGCTLAQPDFVTALRNNNVIFRIPTPTFGAGLIEQIPDSAIIANQAANAGVKGRLGIFGRPNYHVAGRTISGETNNNGNDGTIARFGWKAQNKSLLLFGGEAYNVEQGISNEIFQTEREENPACQFKAAPNDFSNTDNADSRSDVERFAIFMRFLAPPTPSTTTPGGAASISNGKKLFAAVGCALCHTPSLPTNAKSAVAALGGQTANLYSDLLIHDMGVGLADGVSQGQAGPREFRSAPLWGLGQRLFFLHDGRTSDLQGAIRAHASSGSEANGVVGFYNALPENYKQDLLNFLRSL